MRRRRLRHLLLLLVSLHLLSASRKIIITTVILLLIFWLLFYDFVLVELDVVVVDLLAVKLLFTFYPRLLEEFLLLFTTERVKVILRVLRVHELDGALQVWVAVHVDEA